MGVTHIGRDVGEEVAAHRRPLQTDAARPERALTIATLQRLAGNHAVASSLAAGRGRPTLQRCGSAPCDCSAEKRTVTEAPAVYRETDQSAEDGGEVEVEVESTAHDGDTPPGGPVLPVPESPDELTSDESLVEDGAADVRTVALTVSRDRELDPAPQTRRRWISRIAINLAQQTIQYEWSDGAPGGSSSISSGRGRPCTATDPCADQGHRNCTPTGTFHPAFLGGRDYTNSHGDAMAWYVDLGTGRGIGIHNSQLVLGRPASHGCIRVPMAVARIINQNVIRRTNVAISGKAATAPWRDRTCPPRSRR